MVLRMSIIQEPLQGRLRDAWPYFPHPEVRTTKTSSKFLRGTSYRGQQWLAASSSNILEETLKPETQTACGAAQ